MHQYDLTAGRHIDALIAEHIMEWRFGGTFWYEAGNQKINPMPEFSSFLHHAIGYVVEHLNEQGWYLRLAQGAPVDDPNRRPGWRAEFWRRDGLTTTGCHAPTPELAICGAALHIVDRYADAVRLPSRT